MGGVSLLRANPHPTAEQVVQALQGNICRCGTHPRIIEAIQRAAGKMQERSK
jgi:isoquinoline 1-oxidoreductase alpha subunit